MTKWTEFPLRPQGQAWPGLNTRGGILDPGSGQLEDGSFNQIINEADLLEKRKGLVRGIDKRFAGVVCGLFKYTDECGVEYIVVADEDVIQVEQPFDIPAFLGTDSLPFDDFETLDTTRWSNTGIYQVFLGALQLNDTETASSFDYVPAVNFMQWFKSSVLTSYFIEVQYRMIANDGHQGVAVVIKRTVNGDTYLIASVVSNGANYMVTLQVVINGVRSTIAQQDLGGGSIADGFLRISYSVGVNTFTASARVIPSGGNQVTVSGPLTELQDAALGQLSAVGLSRGSVASGEPELESVSGGAA